MTGRVKPVAKLRELDWYKAKPRKYRFSDRSAAAVAHNVKNNERWLRQQIKTGNRIYDIGGDSGAIRAGYGLSSYYNAEKNLMHAEGFRRKLIGGVNLDGNTFALFEWIR